jgi:hypothetical protein
MSAYHIVAQVAVAEVLQPQVEMVQTVGEQADIDVFTGLGAVPVRAILPGRG